MHNCEITVIGDNNTILIQKNVGIVDGRIVICDSDNSVTIGADTSFNKNVVLDCMEGSKLTIGEKCLFSADIVVRTGDWHSIYDAEGKRLNYSKDVVIGKHCWIGDRVSITKGVNLADGTIVGTGAIVTSGIEEKNLIIAGNPAHVLKRDVRWDKERID